MKKSKTHKSSTMAYSKSDSFFPLKIRLPGGKEKIAKTTDDLPNGVAFLVMETRCKDKQPVSKKEIKDILIRAQSFASTISRSELELYRFKAESLGNAIDEIKQRLDKEGIVK